MSIVFDEIEGIVQKDEETASESPPAAAPPSRPAIEVFEESARRCDWIARRLTAD